MGVTVETTHPGDGSTYPKPGDFVTMDYTGKLVDGTVRVDTSTRSKYNRTVVISAARVNKTMRIMENKSPLLSFVTPLPRQNNE